MPTSRTIKISNKQPNFTPQGNREKKTQTQSQEKDGKLINEEQKGINEIETKKTVEKFNESKSWRSQPEQEGKKK